MRKLIAGFGLVLTVLFGAASVISAAAVVPAAYGTSVHAQALGTQTVTGPVLPPDEY